MKIVFLYSEYDVMGGIANVNCALARAFLAQQHEVVFVHMRKRSVAQNVDYPLEAKQILINAKDAWKVPRLNEVKDYAMHLHFIQAFKHLKRRWHYDTQLEKDYQACKAVIKELAADVIICSHYECLNGIGEMDLKKTFHHYHTDLSQLSDQMLAFLQRFNHKLAGFVWLSRNISIMAKQVGLQPNYYVYNPISYHTDQFSDLVKHKKCVFIGRFSAEKRVELLIELFNLANAKLNYSYTLDLYGVGEMSERCKELIDSSKQVNFKGSTQDSKAVFLQASCLLMTSSFEGLPLTLIEANECGVPCIAFDYGASASEIILNHQSGVLVPQDRPDLFVSEMVELLDDDKMLIEMGKQAKLHAQLFTIDKINQQWNDLFKELL